MEGRCDFRGCPNPRANLGAAQHGRTTATVPRRPPSGPVIRRSAPIGLVPRPQKRLPIRVPPRHPQVILAGIDRGAVGERQPARRGRRHIEGRGDPARPAVLIENGIADSEVGHARPPGWGWYGGVERECLPGAAAGDEQPVLPAVTRRGDLLRSRPPQPPQPGLNSRPPWWRRALPERQELPLPARNRRHRPHRAWPDRPPSAGRG